MKPHSSIVIENNYYINKNERGLLDSAKDFIP